MQEISIQHLFGFNVRSGFNPRKILRFQYNTCLGSTELETKALQLLNRFQYNTCLGSTYDTVALNGVIAGISIQHLFGFNKQYELL